METPHQRSLAGPLLGTLVFVALAPGTVVGWIPYWLSGWVMQPPLLGLSLLRWLAVPLFVAAFPLFVSFCGRFVVEGRGTPTPMAPTQSLVVGGPFRRVRNPGYISVVSMIAAQGLFFGSVAVLVYAAFIAICFHVFVVLYEEPTLRRQFGAQYDTYCREVPRWVPRLRR